MAQPPPPAIFAHCASDRCDAVGEAALIRMIRAGLGAATLPSPQGIGDDCAVWPQPPQGEQLLLTTDAIVYGRHFDAVCPPQLAAAKLLKRNLSDIAAMGGTPHSALLALTLAPNQSFSWLQQFIDGLRECALPYATVITGGDITAGTDNFFAAHVTLIGHAPRPLLRSGAQVGDHLFVTGALGGSISGHHLHFEPRLQAGRWLAAQPDVRAMIDITDGLAKDLPELLPDAPTAPAAPQTPAGTAKAAETAKAVETAETAVALLNLAAIPISTAALEFAATSAATALSHALSNGEDYELLFALDAQTDPVAFIRRWQAAFSQAAPPTPGTPAQPQAAYPYHIGHIGSVAAHPPENSRLYDAATLQPLAMLSHGFEHLRAEQP